MRRNKFEDAQTGLKTHLRTSIQNGPAQADHRKDL